MNKPGFQSLAILSLASAALITVYEEGRLTNELDQKDIKGAIKAAEVALLEWPGMLTREEFEDLKETIHKWDKLPVPITKKYKTAVLLVLGERALTDLYEKVNNKFKRLLLEKVLYHISAIRDRNPEDGSDFYVHEQAKILVEQLHELTGWTTL